MRWVGSSDLQIRHIGGCTVARFPREVDLGNTAGIRGTMLRLLNIGVPALIADLSGCRFCDSGGVDALLRAHLRATALKVPFLVVLPVDGPVRTICQITGIVRKIPHATSLAEGLEALQPLPGAVPRPSMN